MLPLARHPPEEVGEGVLVHIEVLVGKDRALPVSAECCDCSSPEHKLSLSQMETVLGWFSGRMIKFKSG